MKDNIVYYVIINKKNIDGLDINNTSESTMAQIVLKKMLDYFNIKMPKIYLTDNGKPFFKDLDIYFNYSHSKNYIACVIAKCDVGIDIEEKTRIINDMVAKRYLNNIKGNLKRIETWVKKEAYSKLKGLGLGIGFQNIYLNELIENNIFINKKEYMCSIYCDSFDIEFKGLNETRLN